MKMEIKNGRKSKTKSLIIPSTFTLGFYHKINLPSTLCVRICTYKIRTTQSICGFISCNVLSPKNIRKDFSIMEMQKGITRGCQSHSVWAKYQLITWVKPEVQSRNVKNLWSWIDWKLQLGLLSVINWKFFHQQRRKSGSSSPSKTVKYQETL